ncbi:MAG: hypothetical protein GX962_03615 [Epulopiscium sp.]|nr:hypothetical protein [Candidatus Epulonipiscium sp.]
MFQKNKKWIMISVLGLGTLLFGWFLTSSVSITRQIQTRLLPNSQSPLSQIKKKATYDLNTSLYVGNISQMKTYRPESKGYTKEQAIRYAEIFQIQALVQEREKDYYFKDEGKELIIDKEIGRIQYRDKLSRIQNKDHVYTETELLRQAVEWAKSKDLNIEYAKAVIHHEPIENQYQIYFINTIGNFYNYSYPQKIVINAYGEIGELEYYQIQYISNGNYRIKKPEIAYEELKTKYVYEEEGFQIDIQQVELVYNGQGKIEPAYRFFGETNQNTIFEKMIPALDPLY